MSLRVRLTLLLALIISATLLLAWVLTRRAVINPFTKEVVAAQLDHAVYVASEIERGVPPERLAEKLGMDLQVRRRPPGFMRGHRPGDGSNCKRDRHRGHKVIICGGPRSPTAVRLNTGEGWVVMRRDLDVDKPINRFAVVLLILAGVIILLSAALAVRITRPLQATVQALQAMADGELSHRLPEGGGRELTEVARAFNGMADRIDQMLRAEKEMMAGISHELRTPLARLRLEIEILRDMAATPKRLDAMAQDIEEVDHLVGEFMEFSRLSLGTQALDDSPLDLRAIVEQALEHHPLPKHTVRIEGDAQPVRGDGPRLVRVLGNLLQNAGKYAPAGTEVTVRLDGRSVEVIDQGPGVPAQDLPQLFEPFYRGTVGRRSSATGYGLGLMYARQVITLCSGQIEARLVPGAGLGIRFELPPAEPAPVSHSLAP